MTLVRGVVVVVVVAFDFMVWKVHLVSGVDLDTKFSFTLLAFPEHRDEKQTERWINYTGCKTGFWLFPLVGVKITPVIAIAPFFWLKASQLQNSCLDEDALRLHASPSAPLPSSSLITALRRSLNTLCCHVLRRPLKIKP